MTKELKQESEEYTETKGKERFRKFYNSDKNIAELITQVYMDSAEPREKRIAELEAQIEKIINEIDKTMVLSNMRECEICNIQDIFRKYGFKRNSNDVWEIKEND